MKVFITSLFVLATVACDGTGGGSGDPLTGCDLSFTAKNSGGKDFGEECTQDSECRYGECMKPGADGNITNASFGFCTRGCDCENSTDSRLTTDEKEVLECLYPSGFKDIHHVVVQCSTLEDCTAVSDKWTECKSPDSGGVQKVCHAL